MAIYSLSVRGGKICGILCEWTCSKWLTCHEECNFSIDFQHAEQIEIWLCLWILKKKRENLSYTVDSKLRALADCRDRAKAKQLSLFANHQIDKVVKEWSNKSPMTIRRKCSRERNRTNHQQFVFNAVQYSNAIQKTRKFVEHTCRK